MPKESNFKKEKEFANDIKCYLEEMSPLRNSCLKLDLGPNIATVENFQKCYTTICRPHLELAKMESHMIPMFEIACNPANIKEKNVYSKKVREEFLEEEIKAFDFLSKVSGNQTILIIRTDITVLPANEYDKKGKLMEYGLSIFENIGVVKGTGLNIKLTPVRA